jgi:hypothetical protein
MDDAASPGARDALMMAIREAEGKRIAAMGEFQMRYFALLVARRAAHASPQPVALDRLVELAELERAERRARDALFSAACALPHVLMRYERALVPLVGPPPPSPHHYPVAPLD